MSHQIQFRFIRKADFGVNSGAKDDVVTIKPVDSNLYSLNYVHRYQGEVQTTYVIVKEADALSWLSSLLPLVGADKDPFYRIQLDLPHYPSIMLNSYDMGDQLYVIIEAVRFSLQNFPPSRTIRQEKAAIAEAEDEEKYEADEDEDETMGIEEEEENEEDYYDMPGLIPASEIEASVPTRVYNFVPAPEGSRHLFLDHE
jgi:hypothetical protein